MKGKGIIVELMDEVNGGKRIQVRRVTKHNEERERK